MADVGAPYERAVIRHRGKGSGGDIERLKQVAETLDASDIPYDWEYMGRWRTLNLVVPMHTGLAPRVQQKPRAFAKDAEEQKEADA